MEGCFYLTEELMRLFKILKLKGSRARNKDRDIVQLVGDLTELHIERSSTNRLNGRLVPISDKSDS